MDLDMIQGLRGIILGSFVTLALAGCCDCRPSSTPPPQGYASQAYKTIGHNWYRFEPADGNVLLSSISRTMGDHVYILASRLGKSVLVKTSTDTGGWKWSPEFNALANLVEDPSKNELIYFSTIKRSMQHDLADGAIPFPSPITNPYGQVWSLDMAKDGTLVAVTYDVGACCQPPTGSATSFQQLKVLPKDGIRWQSAQSFNRCSAAGPVRMTGDTGVFGPCYETNGKASYLYLSNSSGQNWYRTPPLAKGGSTVLLSRSDDGGVIWISHEMVNGIGQTLIRQLDAQGRLKSSHVASESILKARYVSSDAFIAAYGRRLTMGNASNGIMKLVLELPAGSHWQDVAYLGGGKFYAISLSGFGGLPKSHVFYSDDGGTTWLDQTSQIFGSKK